MVRRLFKVIKAILFQIRLEMNCGTCGGIGSHTTL